MVRHGKALAFSHSREPWCTPCKRCAFACEARPILSAHRTRAHARAYASHSAPLHLCDTSPLSYRRYAHTVCVGHVGGLNPFAYTARRCCYERLTMWGMSPSACGHVCASHHDTCGGHMTGRVRLGRDMEDGVAHSSGVRAECLRGASGNHHTTARDPMMPPRSHPEPTYRGATYLRHQTSVQRVLRELPNGGPR